MFIVVAVSVLGSALLFGVMHPAKLVVAFGVIACPVLAITVTFGLFALARLRTNTILLIMPFLVMGIGDFHLPCIHVLLLSNDEFSFGCRHQWTLYANFVQRFSRTFRSFCPAICWIYSYTQLNHCAHSTTIDYDVRIHCTGYDNNVAGELLCKSNAYINLGVNGAFLVIHSWLRSVSECTTAQRLGFVLEEAGPSITISTLTNVITFGIGALTPTPG